MEEDNRYIRFDWAAKRMLRDKANFGVLEGLMAVLIGEQMKIEEILESESNQDDERDKFNRVDIKARNSKGEIVLVEIQQTRELYFLQRLLYGVAKAITEHMTLGDKYDQVKKVYSISILYFDLGEGSDYLYHGQNKLVGVHTGDTLRVNTRERDQIRMTTPESIFPEYYIIRVNEFNQVATTPLEEWLDYLKNGRIKSDTKAPGLGEARKKLVYMQMTPEERRAYDRHMDNIMVQNDVLETKVLEGLVQGRAEGRAEGREQGLQEGRAEGLQQGRAEGLQQGREEGLQQGREEGLQQGLQQGLQEGLQEGLQQGRAEGIEQGLRQGLQQGRAEGERAAMIETARRMMKANIPPDVVKAVTGLTDSELSALR